jgi:6,7-dimethyl-8-ribityllumazine synthase
MLKKTARSRARAAGGRFAIVASNYNRRYVDAMLREARKVLQSAGAGEVTVVRVPGAFEIPVVAARLAASDPPFAALICLGVILRGATTHAQNISDVVSFALGDIAARRELPVIHEVLLLENEQQARERCLGREHNRGAEAAHTALTMAAVMSRLGAKKPAQLPSRLRSGSIPRTS